MVKRPKDTYNVGMDYLDDIKREAKDLSGQRMTNFIQVIYEEFKDAQLNKEPPYITLYYRDLLSFLIKTYGH